MVMVMAEVVNVNLISRRCFYSPCSSQQPNLLHHKLSTRTNNASFLCLLSNNNNNNNNNNNTKQEQARKALEAALSGKKSEYDKWDKEIKRKEDLGARAGGGGATGGGGGGGGGWFGWGGRFGWSNDDHFWQEAKRASLTILGILLMYLLLAKTDFLLAIIFNPLLYALRGLTNGFSFITSKIFNTNTSNQSTFDAFSKQERYQHASAKQNVIRKWGTD